MPTPVPAVLRHRPWNGVRDNLRRVTVGAVICCGMAAFIGWLSAWAITGGIPSAVSVRTVPAPVTGYSHGVPVRTLTIHERTLADDAGTSLHFEIDRVDAGGRSTPATLVGSTGRCYRMNGTEASLHLNRLPYSRSDCTVSFLAPGGPETDVLSIQHRWFGYQITPFWFGNQTVQHEARGLTG